MDHSSIGLVALDSPFHLLQLGLASRRLHWTDWVQARVLRLTGECRLVATAWGHTISPRKPLAPRRAGGVTLVGIPSAGIRRSPARASAPTAPSLPGERAVGSTVRPDASPRRDAAVDGSGPGVHSPFAGATTALPDLGGGQGGPQLTAAASETPSLAAAVFQMAGAS